MSKTNVLPEPAAAHDHLYDRVHSQVFFGRLASRGYPVHNEKQAMELLQLAAIARQNGAQEKQAAESPYSGVLSAVQQVMADRGMQTPRVDETLAIKQAAAELAEDPDIYNSMLSLMAYEAQQAQQ